MGKGTDGKQSNVKVIWTVCLFVRVVVNGSIEAGSQERYDLLPR